MPHMKIKSLKLYDTGPLARADSGYQNLQQLYVAVQAISQSDSNLLPFIYDFAHESLHNPLSFVSPLPLEILLLP